MLDVISAVQELFEKSAATDFSKWLSNLPKGASWYVISDYVFDDPDRHDTASFVVLLSHDRLETILGYIQNQAPVDIKRSKQASEGLVKYLTSPVIFSFTFVLDEGDNFFSKYASIGNVLDGLEDLLSFSSAIQSGSESKTYFAEVNGRLALFAKDMRQKGNAKLARKVLLVASLAAVVMDYLDQNAEPTYIYWVSDRDAILQRYDGVVWDVASLYFFYLKFQRIPPFSMINKPILTHVVPEAKGKNYLDPMIRLADYLAAAASSLNFYTFEYGHPKLRFVGNECFKKAKNSVLCTMSWTGEGFHVRRYLGNTGSD
ncbi:hypothetical protein [Pseudomonas tohonis]|uniref:hypothetical protein n=1 Tax=Pseudomonas tohonis TaxID=2725477 RepID=UPI0021DA7283|nr:hypothetical protein [Pseudomonas tohonis]UXY55405.1 hypothetical protein N9L84_12800 [Pseudomonas tohonis]